MIICLGLFFRKAKIDFTLFDDYPEFCATYMMRNIRNHNLYSSKFVLKVVELNHVELATEEDIYYGIDQWARLFKATFKTKRC